MWSQQMSVGLLELDADHEQVIRIINSLETPAGNTESGLRQAGSKEVNRRRVQRAYRVRVRDSRRLGD